METDRLLADELKPNKYFIVNVYNCTKYRPHKYHFVTLKAAKIMLRVIGIGASWVVMSEAEYLDFKSVFETKG